MPPRRESSPFIPNVFFRKENASRHAPAGVPTPLRGRPGHQQKREENNPGSNRQHYAQPPDPGFPGAYSNQWGYAVPPNPYPPQAGHYPPPGPYPPHPAHFAPPPGPYPPHAADMHRLVPRSTIEELSPREYNLLIKSYRVNRSTARHAPGGEFGAPVKRGDVLHKSIMFDGIVEDEAFTLRKLVASGPGWKGLKTDSKRRGYPVTLVLNLGRIHGRTDHAATRTGESTVTGPHKT
ncbi:hypothetical protein BU17DRAFT_101190 [Hysterangium stoloniferum]|nr:hypothetical protein BU17DRAFT_101190 [Hysterangium stoloniferum]